MTRHRPRRHVVRVCERCGNAFSIAPRFKATLCGPCRVAKDAQSDAIQRLEILQAKVAGGYFGTGGGRYVNAPTRAEEE